MSVLSDLVAYTNYPKIQGVYCIRNVVTNMNYIGSARNLRERIRHHQWMLRNDRHENSRLQNAYNKYGNNSFYFIVLDMWSDYPLLDVEQHFIDGFSSYIKGVGYNILPKAGSSAGVVMAQETKDKISEFHKGKNKTTEHNLKNSLAQRGELNHMFGKKLSEGHRAKLIGDRLKVRKPFSIINPNGEVVSGIGICEFAKQNNLSYRSLVGVMSGRIKQYKKYKRCQM